MMKRWLKILIVLALAAPVRAQEEDPSDLYRYGRLRTVEPSVAIERANESGAEEAQMNYPFLPGDRLFSDGTGRAEIQFFDGTVLRIDARTKLDYAAHDGGPEEEQATLRLWSGSLFLHTWDNRTVSYTIEAAATEIGVADRSVVRIDVRNGEVRASVYEGEAVLRSDGRRVTLGAMERSFVRYGEEPDQPREFNQGERDAFAEWNRDRQEEMRWAATSQRYVPEEIAPYAADLDANGAWSYETDIGYVWRPTVEVDWQPYVHGRWAWSIFGWTWIPAERWGWISCHYGRWGHSARLGWYWIPRRGFSPAWVHWARGNGQVGWCPLDRNNRPLEMERAIRISRAAQRRGYRGNGGMTHGAWIFSRHEDLRTPDLARRSLLGHDPGARGLRLSETFRERPSRNLARLERVDPRPVMARRSERRERTLPSALSAAPTRRRAGETSSWNHDNGSGSDAGSGVVRRPQMPRPRGDENDRAREAAPRERRDEPRSRIFQRDDSESRWRARTQAQDSERPRIFTPRRDETPAPNRDDRVFRRSHEERRSEGIFPRMRRENPAPERHGERREREYRPPPTQRFPSERRGETERAQPERRMERESSRPNSGERGNHRRNRN